jgi:3-methyladenine DNA glycosylase Tag
MRPFVNMLAMFMMQVIRRDVGLYPPTIIQSFIRALGCLKQAHEEQCTLKACTTKTFQYPY